MKTGNRAMRGAAALAGIGLLAFLLFRGSGEDGRPAPGSPGAPSVAPPDSPAPDPSPAPDSTPPPPPPPAEPEPGEESRDPSTEAAGTCGFSVEVVDEAGRRLPAGSVRLHPSLEAFTRKEVMRPLVGLLRPFDLAEGNPVVRTGLPGAVDGITGTARAVVPGMPPSAGVEFALAKGRIVEVRLVVASPRTLEVEVLDLASGTPIAGARVLSRTERERRDSDSGETAGDRGPGWATTDAAGRALLTDLGAGDHDLEISARGRRPLRLQGVPPGSGPKVCRMERAPGSGSVRVTVRGPAGETIADFPVEIRLFSVEATLRRTTDADGVAVFEEIPPGHAIVRLDLIPWSNLVRERGWPDYNVGEATDPVEIGAGDALDLVLGYRGGTGAVACEVVDAAGAPAGGIRLTFSGETYRTAETDGRGRALFEGLPAGEFRMHLEGRGDWMDGSRTLEDGERKAVRLVLGDRTAGVRVRGEGAEGGAVAGATVHLDGPRYASGKTGSGGTVSFPGALPGRYGVGVVADGFAYAEAVLEVPPAADPPLLEIHLVRGGRILLRLAPGAEPPAEEGIRLLDASGESLFLGADDAGAHFRETPLLAPGRYTLEIDRPDGTVSRRIVEVRNGEDTDVRIGGP